ncbi:MAG: ABC transporter permease [Planctomycetes bacterium]|nr:ABC transporter permease [Planctomycetota bacterium]
MSWREHRAALLALLVLGALALLSLLVPFLPLQDPGGVALAEQLEGPSARHWFGTDALGRDLFARTLVGVRSSLFIGLLGAFVSLFIGVAVGAVAGFSGRVLDGLLMRMVDALYGIPFICLVIFLLAVLRDHEPALRAHGITRETVLYTVVGATTWLTMARLVRNEVVTLRARPFVEAARALGIPGRRILARHILPNTLGIILVALTLTIPSIVLYEAFLSFLGLGIEPPGVSLGLLAAEGVEAISPVHASWWMIAFPGAALALLLLSFSLLGDGLRDLLDPRGAARRG